MMNVLEKILEEIEERANELRKSDNERKKCAYDNKDFERLAYFQNLIFATDRTESVVKDIIRSHMDEVENDERLIKKYVTNRQVVRDFRNKPLYIKGCCPKCGYELKSCETDYCRVCGQALRWDNPEGRL